MTDKEKIRAEIERRLSFYREAKFKGRAINVNRIDEAESLLSFIDSMQEEPTSKFDLTIQPDDATLNETLGKIARQITPKVLSCEATAFYDEDFEVLSDEEECVKAGIRWYRQQMLERAVDVEFRNIFGEVLPTFNLSKAGITSHGKYKALIIKED